MKKYYINLIVVLVVMSCSIGQDKSLTKEIYKNGKLKELIIYDKHNDSINYIKKIYREDDGTLSLIGRVSNGTTNGLVKCYRRDGTLSITQTVQNDNFHGITTIYDSNQNIINRQLYVNDTIMFCEIITYKTDSVIKQNYNMESEGNRVMLGQMLYVNGTMIDEYSNYYDYVAKDTIQLGGTLDIKIKGNFYTTPNEYLVYVLIGELNRKNDFDIKPELFTSETPIVSIKLDSSNYKFTKGINTVTGKLGVFNKRNGQKLATYPFFHNVLVE